MPEPIFEFTEELLGKELSENVRMSGYSKPTPVQKYSVPIGNAGRDLMACAQTGSGKTAGFLFPVITQMLRYGPAEIADSERKGGRCFPTALILAPTRELATQIFEESSKFLYCTGIAPVVVYGGAPIKDQLRALERGCDLMVGTPGRLFDLLYRNRVALQGIRYLILDEADRMLDMGFEPQIRSIVEEFGMPRDRQTFMFSATFPREIQRLAADFLNDYVFLAVGRVGSAAKDISQTIEYVEESEKFKYIVHCLNTIDDGLILIFVETKRSADMIEYNLCREGYPATSIHGDKDQRDREEALHKFKTGKCPVLVATDVASRGLDINNVTHVINYDMPANIDDYVHRIGRTGRAGNTGAAVSLMNEKNRNIARDLYDLLRENAQVTPAWLETLATGGYRDGRSGRGGRGGSKFGSRDYRREDRGAGGGHTSPPSRRGGAGGGGAYRGGGGGGSYKSGGGAGGAPKSGNWGDEERW